MLSKSIAYHLEQLRQYQHVIDADGNIFSDDHRRDARQKITLHNDIIAELDKANEPVDGLPALDVINAMFDQRMADIKRLGRMEDAAGPGISRQMMIQDIRKMEPERDALEVAIQLLREVAARPAIQHHKGGTYDEYGRGILQTDTPLTDNAELVAYRDRASRRWFFRPPAEMDDGRFTPFDPASGEPIVLKTRGPLEVQVLIEGLDDRKITFTRAEITNIERGQTVRFTSDSTDDEDIWGSYKPVMVTYVGTDVASVKLKML